MIFLTGFFLIFWIACQQKTDNSDHALIQKIANQILEAHSTNTLIQPISKTNGNLSLEKAYAVQLKISGELSKSFGPIAGYKLGYSDSSSLKKNNINIPAYGPIFKNQIKKSGDTIPAKDYRNFSIEQEIVFTIAKTIDQKVSSIDELVPYVQSVHTGFDMPEVVFDDPTNIIDFVADCAGSKYFALSEGLDPKKTDISDIAISVKLRDGIIYKGTSKNELGNPWFALKEVANDLVERGRPLKAGYVIFSGKVAPTYKMQSNMAKGIYKGIASPFTDLEVIVK